MNSYVTGTGNDRDGLAQRVFTVGIRDRLLIAFIAVAFFTAGLGLYTVTAVDHINRNQQVMYTDQFGGMELFSRYLDATYQVRINVVAYALTSNPVVREQLRQRIADGDAEITARATDLDAADVDRVDIATLADTTAAWKAYTDWRDNVLFGPAAEADPAAATAA